MRLTSLNSVFLVDFSGVYIIFVLILYRSLFSSKIHNYTKDVAHCVSICNDNATTDEVQYDFRCKISNPVMVYDNDITEEMLKIMTAAESTVPCFLKLAQSNIPGANRGIFTKYRLPKDMIFGPYRGIILSDYGEEGDKAKISGYAWKIKRYKDNGDEDHFNIDGQHENSANWLRWVNSARFLEEQNMIPLIFNNSVYYMTRMDVEPETELLIWYGRAYAQNALKIFTMKGSGHDWENNFAPSQHIVICPTCIRTDGPRDGDDEPDEGHHSEGLMEPSSEKELDDPNENVQQTNEPKLPANPQHAST